MARHSGVMVLVALMVAGVGVWGIARLPTSFIPIEDQGYVLVAAQLPDGAAVGPHAAGDGRGDQDRAGRAWRRSGDRDQRHLGAGQQRHAGECRRRLCDPEGLERAQARQRRRSALGVRQSAGRAGQAAGRGGPGADSAADPGHRQRQRFHHAGRAARRQLRLRQAADDDPDHREGRQYADRPAAAQHDVPRRRAADPRGGGSGQGGDAECGGRRCVQRARRLCRIELRQSVQQIRPHLPGLCAGGLEVPPAAERHREAVCAQPGQQDGAARHAGADPADGRAVADRPVQSVSDGDASSAVRRKASAPARR